ncbi:flagellar motor switch protein FliM [Salicibibacter halophilus]|uniref:Flagellar motor switch protein FliM n=1 Tax=Salicibibacter halophilus TaxID=2502791 RepID=A0A514LG96_9BACI|nr:flagellar motor switch protein FliM [Salicibibacter halophilus]QDI90291.1 flagellar motor switch protein FliM [Salicibibacter halophilus]
MADVLSQGEIDELLSALSTGEMDAEELRKEIDAKKITTYDFKRALRFSKDQIRSLTRMHENFARLFTTSLSARLRTYVQVSVGSVEQLPYEEFIRSIPKMTFLHVFEAPPLEGRLLIEMNPQIGYAMLDRILGGAGSDYNKIENLTEIETRILSQMAKYMMDSFQQAWQSVVDIETEMVDLEVNPQFMQMVSSNETVVVVSLSATIGETAGMINICLPYVVLEEILPKLSGHYWLQTTRKARDEQEEQKIETSVRQAHLALQAVLGHSTISVEEMLHLCKGDVIELDQAVNDPMVAYVGHEPKFYVQAGKKNQRLAVQVTEDFDKGEE